MDTTTCAPTTPLRGSPAAARRRRNRGGSGRFTPGMLPMLLLLALGLPACATEPTWSWRQAPPGAPAAAPGQPATQAGSRRPLPKGPPTYSYGAKFEPPDGRILHGMGQWLAGNANYLRALDDPALNPAASLYFLHLGDWVRPWESLIESGSKAFAAEVEAGRMLHLSLSLDGMDVLTRQRVAIDRELAQPSRYDEHVRDVARVVRRLGVPTFVRIGFEFNGPWNGYSPGWYPLAYRRVVELFREEGVDNAAFVWAWESSSPRDFDARDAGAWRWYPGDDVVDWFGLDLFNAADFSPRSLSRGKVSRHGNVLDFLEMAEKHGKPVMVAESGAVLVDITPPEADGRRDWDAWFEPFFTFLAAHPSIKAFHYCNSDWKGNASAQANGWKDGDISHNAWLARRYAAEMRDPLYLHARDLPLLRGWPEPQPDAPPPR